MSFLDELKRQAEEEKERELEATQNQLKAFTANFTTVDARMRQIFRYLLELSKHLDGLKLFVKRSYYLETYGNLEGWEQQGYKVSGKKFTKDERDYLKEIQFRFVCRGGEPVVIEKTNEEVATRFKDQLWRYSLRFEMKEFRNQRAYLEKAIFTIAPEIPVVFQFVADHDQGTIDINIKNFGMFALNKLRYDADEVDDYFLDELAKYVVGKPSNFRALGHRQKEAAERIRQSRAQASAEEARRRVEEAAAEEEEDRRRAEASGQGGDGGPAGEETGGLKGVLGKVKTLLNTRIV